MQNFFKRLLALFLVAASSFVLSYIYSEDLYLKIGSGTLDIFYAEFSIGTIPLIFYLVINAE